MWRHHHVTWPKIFIFQNKKSKFFKFSSGKNGITKPPARQGAGTERVEKDFISKLVLLIHHVKNQRFIHFFFYKSHVKWLQPHCSYFSANLSLKVFLFCSYSLIFSLKLFLACSYKKKCISKLKRHINTK